MTVLIKMRRFCNWLQGNKASASFIIRKPLRSPDWCGSVGWVSSRKVKVCRFDSWSGHMPGLPVQSPVRAHMGGNRSKFLSHTDVFLPLFLTFFPLLKNKKIQRCKKLQNKPLPPVHAGTLLNAEARLGRSTSIQALLFIALLGSLVLFNFGTLPKLKEIFAVVGAEISPPVKQTVRF